MIPETRQNLIDTQRPFSSEISLRPKGQGVIINQSVLLVVHRRQGSVRARLDVYAPTSLNIVREELVVHGGQKRPKTEASGDRVGHFIFLAAKPGESLFIGDGLKVEFAGRVNGSSNFTLNSSQPLEVKPVPYSGSFDKALANSHH